MPSRDWRPGNTDKVTPGKFAISQGYPDKAMLNVTLAQLKAAPDFQYAQSPLADSETRTSGGSDQMKKTTP